MKKVGQILMKRTRCDPYEEGAFKNVFGEAFPQVSYDDTDMTEEELEKGEQIKANDELELHFGWQEGYYKALLDRVLVELVNIFSEYEDEIRIVGGWVPDLMFPGEGHIGSGDVDILAGMYGGTQPKRRS